MFWSGILPTKFGGHRALLSNLTPGWPRMTPAWPLTPAMHYALVRGSSHKIWWPKDVAKQIDPYLTPADPYMTFDPNNALRSGQGFFPPNLVAIGHLLSNLTPTWPQLTPTWPLTPAMHYTLVSDSSHQIWWPWGISKQFDPWLTPDDSCMTFEPSNALHSGQGFLSPNLVAIGHF